MNRRGFFTSLLAAPLAAKAIAETITRKTPPADMSSAWRGVKWKYTREETSCTYSIRTTKPLKVGDLITLTPRGEAQPVSVGGNAVGYVVYANGNLAEVRLT